MLHTPALSQSMLKKVYESFDEEIHALVKQLDMETVPGRTLHDLGVVKRMAADLQVGNLHASCCRRRITGPDLSGHNNQLLSIFGCANLSQQLPSHQLP